MTTTTTAPLATTAPLMSSHLMTDILVVLNSFPNDRR